MTATAALPATAPRMLMVKGALVLSLTAVLAVSAHVQVPFWPVPMTLQTLAVLAIAGLAGPAVAGAAMLAYIAEGAAGLPVFASGGGIAYLAGPTAGYLAGMTLAAVLVGALVRRANGHVLATAGAMLLGIAITYGAGAAWLAQFVGMDKAFAAGVAPFLLGDAVKAALAAALVLAAKPLARG